MCFRRAWSSDICAHSAFFPCAIKPISIGTKHVSSPRQITTITFPCSFPDSQFQLHLKMQVTSVECWISVNACPSRFINIFKHYGLNIQLMIHSTLIQHTTQHFGSCKLQTKIRIFSLMFDAMLEFDLIESMYSQSGYMNQGFAMAGNLIPFHAHIA